MRSQLPPQTAPQVSTIWELPDAAPLLSQLRSLADVEIILATLLSILVAKTGRKKVDIVWSLIENGFKDVDES